MKKLKSCVLLLIICLIVPLYAAEPVMTTTDENQATHHNQKKAKYLIVIRATDAKIIKTDAGYVLTLTGTDGHTLFFADRPVRKAGLVPTEELMNSWEQKSNSLTMTPPNAAILFRSMNADKRGISHAVAVELKKPVTIGKDSWSFSMTDLEGKLRPGHYQGVTIFVDSLLLDTVNE